MSSKEQFEYTCDVCGIVVVVGRDKDGGYGWPDNWQHLDYRSLDIRHICTACTASFEAWIKLRRSV